MAVYVVATRRECRGRTRTAAEVVSSLRGVKIRGSANPDRVVIESAEAVDELRSRLGASYYVEPEVGHRTLSRRL
jgi:hypothetical protein